MGNKIPIVCENIFYFMTGNYIFSRGLGIASKPKFDKQSMHHEKGNRQNHEMKKLTTRSSSTWLRVARGTENAEKNIWTQILIRRLRRFAQMRSKDR